MSIAERDLTKRWPALAVTTVGATEAAASTVHSATPIPLRPPTVAVAPSASAQSAGHDEAPQTLDLDMALGRWLLAEHVISELDLSRAQRIRSEQSQPVELSTLLVSLGIVSDVAMAQTLGELLHLHVVGTEEYPEAPVLPELVTVRFLKEHRLVPLGIQGDCARIAMAEPQNDYAAQAIAAAFRLRVERGVGVGSQLDAALARLYGVEHASPTATESDHAHIEAEEEEDVAHLRDMASEAPVIRLVNRLLQRATECSASDIHIEPFEGRLQVRYRIDGVLREAEAPSADLAAAVVSRIKLVARLNIAERRLPQDGRITMRIGGSDLDVRVSTVPTMHGESVVLRLLNRNDVDLDLDALGFAAHAREKLRSALALPHGLILVTGPTGSGKTTTLYSALRLLNSGERKIITAEDPVEYQLPGVNQIQVRPAIDLTFANALRSIVRQDPDVIMVGELRDRETATMCVQAALTGHLVFSTLHTNDAASTMTRLLDMGVEDYLLTSTLRLIVAQRLVRLLCGQCREAYRPAKQLITQLGLDRQSGDRPIELYRPRGCMQCMQTGYRRRVAIVEVLEMNAELERMVLAHADARRIQRRAVALGMRTMLEEGCAKALAGLTSVEEVQRVIRDC